jgi:hypothetical protein
MPKAVVIAAQIRQYLTIGVVQVEVASELGWSRLASIATVALLLLVGKEINGHGGESETGSSTDNTTYLGRS